MPCIAAVCVILFWQTLSALKQQWWKNNCAGPSIPSTCLTNPCPTKPSMDNSANQSGRFGPVCDDRWSHRDQLSVGSTVVCVCAHQKATAIFSTLTRVYLSVMCNVCDSDICTWAQWRNTLCLSTVKSAQCVLLCALHQCLLLGRPTECLSGVSW